MILAGDVGGTKTVLALYAHSNGTLERRDEEVYRSSEHASLEEVIAHFLAGRGAAIEAVCVGVAGPVLDGRVRVTNLPWAVDEEQLARAAGGARARVLNDLEAAAYGVLDLGPADLESLNPEGRPGPRRNAVVVAAGTGLGIALLVWDGSRHVAVATESGHAGFAPRDDEQIELLRFLRARLGSHVSVERVLSGIGLPDLYRFTRERSGRPEPAWLAERMRTEDPGAVVGEVGLAGTDPVCVRCLETFVSIYGAEAGDAALRCMALGGVYLAGGIAPKILPALRSAAFLEQFTNKGRFSDLMRGIEVKVVLDPRTPIRGAARVASQLSHGTW